ncbi:hypothetical protein COW81_01645 [Candidatus Campbellbacteria bacterium CG22_combo_CG10-13_8_21_14_all_36_13]|uniref:Membrane fusion protein biotin-lipoyl like domain-containing protein n=1 Tax=Candidatus Campbellbacteria bacterium CG22_combo_CG10-13_8_21_14_all_36_13 TaxID=1974529 RepID=A0A2H0DYC1_9BACT|nr:MAG: hypothetical protein COW81_01645 [Candidatus Campbellbacteria bacterium CG22_combo_CG10-13_8_21_14_all_36_13]
MINKIKKVSKKVFDTIDRVYKRLGLIKTLSIVLVIITIIVFGKIFSSKDVLTNNDNLKTVNIEYVLNLSGEKVPLSLIGKVESKNEADLRAESQGEITAIYASLGDRVYAGQILAEISNALQRAGVQQAQATLDIAKSNYNKLTSGARGEEKDILFTSVENAQNSYKEAIAGAQNTIQTAYSVADDILFNKIDPLFNGARTERPKLSFITGDSQGMIDAESDRLTIGYVMRDWKSAINSLTEANTINILDESQKNLEKMRDFLNLIAKLVNIFEPTADIDSTTLTTWKTNILSARSSVNTIISSVISTRTALNGAITSLEIAKKNQEIGNTGGRSEDVVSAEATVKQAEAGLRSAQASLEKTIVRTPISGVLNLFEVKKGDFVSIYQPVAVVSNNNNLVVTTYITEDESRDIQIGNEVSIKENSTGIITAIAPGLNPVTKKIEVTISPKDNTKSLVNGETVRISLDRNASIVEQLPTQIRIPIKALKIEPSRTVVFSVDPTTSTLISHEVTLGPIVGEKVIIKDGINFDLEIVTDARGLKEGEKVIVN